MQLAPPLLMLLCKRTLMAQTSHPSLSHLAICYFFNGNISGLNLDRGADGSGDKKNGVQFQVLSRRPSCLEELRVMLLESDERHELVILIV